jgi:hypothetical protein
MSNLKPNRPETYRADRWRVTLQRTGRWFAPAVKRFFGAGLVATLTLALGAIFFGAEFLFAEAQSYVAGIVAVAVVLLLSVIMGLLVLGLNWLDAPAIMWRRDQETITELQKRLVPKLQLALNPDDYRKLLPRGEVSESYNGTRWINRRGHDEHIVICCVNDSDARIDDVELYATLVGFQPEDGSVVPRWRILDPVRIQPLSGGQLDKVSLLECERRYFSVLVRASEFNCLRFNSRNLPLQYGDLFDLSGTYEIAIRAHGRETAAAETMLVQLKIMPFPDANTGRPVYRYDIAWVRRKEV